MMISCKKASDLICQSIDRPLSLWERGQLRFHLLMCRGCTAFYKQNQAMLQAFEQRFRGPADPQFESQVEGLPPDVCDRLKQRLREAAAQSSPPE
jgi:hypothetical protein